MPASIVAVAAQVGAVDQGRAAGVQLGHEGVIGAAAVAGLEGAGVVGKLVEEV